MSFNFAHSHSAPAKIAKSIKTKPKNKYLRYFKFTNPNTGLTIVGTGSVGQITGFSCWTTGNYAGAQDGGSGSISGTYPSDALPSGGSGYTTVTVTYSAYTYSNVLYTGSAYYSDASIGCHTSKGSGAIS